jgi:hypothetical protein
MLRARMLDWMFEVTASYKFTHKTYFDGVHLMDRYFELERESLQPGKLHIVGVLSMLTASKMEEVYPLKLKTVFEKIGHRKLPLEELIDTEARMLATLDYRLNCWTFFDLACLKLTQLPSRKLSRPVLGEILLSRLNSEECQIVTPDQSYKKMEEIASYLCKLALYDY